MIHNKNMSSEEFKVLQNFILVKPIELDRGELKTDTGLVLELEQNQSIVDRPTTGTVLKVGPDVNHIKIDSEILWVEQDGQDILLSDGEFLILKETSVLGYKDV